MKKIYFLTLLAFVGFSCTNQTELSDVMESTSLPAYQTEGISRSSNSISERDNTTYSADDGNPAVTYQVHYNWGWGGDNDGYYASLPTYKNDVQQLILKH